MSVVISQLRYRASFACSVKRSTTNGDQQDDFMMWTTCANDLRHEMALESRSVLMKVNQRTTENMRARTSNFALTSTSLSSHKSGSNGLSHTSSCLKHLDFLKVKLPDTASHNEEILSTSVLNLWNWNINDLLWSSRFPNTYHAYQIQQLKHRLCVLLNHAVPAMDSLHGVTPRIRTTIERRIFLFAPQGD